MHRTRWAAGSLAAALLLAVPAVLLGVTGAQGQVVAEPTIHFAFTGMVPGEQRSDSAPVEVAVEATLTDVRVTELENTADAFVWAVSLCPSGTGGCIPVTESGEGRRVPSGTYALTVDIRLGEGAPAGARSEIEGRIRLVERVADDDDGGGLPPTGFAARGLLVAAVALTVLGLVLLLATRRRGENP